MAATAIASADRQPHAQTGASGCEEGLEHPRQHIRSDARALILDADLSGSGTLGPRLHGDLAPLGRDLGVYSFSKDGRDQPHQAPRRTGAPFSLCLK
jgi:hypothetical protein